MLYAGYFVADGGVDSEFFLQLAAQGITGLFALLNFSARKFPLQRHRLMAGALADENLAAPHDEACDDALHGRRRVIARSERAAESAQAGHTKAVAMVALGEAMSKFTAAASYFNFKICGGVKMQRSSTGGF